MQAGRAATGSHRARVRPELPSASPGAQGSPPSARRHRGLRESSDDRAAFRGYGHRMESLGWTDGAAPSEIPRHS